MSQNLSWYPPKVEWLGNEFGCPPFDVLNQMLYESVERNPSNTDRSQIIGKLMLIGRTYSASVERRKTNGDQKDERQALVVVIEAADAISKSKLEALLSELSLDESLTLERIPFAVEVHLELAGALAKANGRENSSLASKYLHFHRPHFFPIVDSYVREGWSWVMDALGLSCRGWRMFGKVSHYGAWCERVIQLQGHLADTQNEKFSLRQIDNYLLSIMSLDGKGGWGLPKLPG